MEIHKFKLANPCGPCQWHLASGVKIFAWFDLIFQAVFIIPVILQFKIFVSQDVSNTTESDTGCYPDRGELAVPYSVFDIFNLSFGMISDIVIYIGVKQSSLKASIACTWIFLIAAVIRQALHVSGTVLHLIRCTPRTYPYEIVLRLLCQYLIYGMWIVAEYLVWLYKGRKFVPRRGLMEPPVERILDEKPTVTSLTTTENSCDIIMPVDSGGDFVVLDDKEERRERLKEKWRSKKNSHESGKPMAQLATK